MALVDEELVEHERWNLAREQVGDVGGAAGSKELAAGETKRAAAIVQVIGASAITQAGYGAGTGLLMGGGLLAIEKFVPGIGPMIGGGLAIWGMSKGWNKTKEAWENVEKLEGLSPYQALAEKFARIATLVDFLGGAVQVLAGLAGLVAVGAALLAIPTAGASLAVAIPAAAIAAIVGLVGSGIQALSALEIQPLVMLMRALHAFTSKADPREIEAQGHEIGESAGKAANMLGAIAGAAVAGLAAKGLSGKAPPAGGESEGLAGSKGLPAGEGPAVVAEPSAPAAGSEIIDPATGQPASPSTPRIISPHTGAPASMAEPSILDPTTGQPVAPAEPQIISPHTGAPASAGEPSILDPTTGEPVNPETPRIISPHTGAPATTAEPTILDPATGEPVASSELEPGAGAEPPKFFKPRDQWWTYKQMLKGFHEGMEAGGEHGTPGVPAWAYKRALASDHEPELFAKKEGPHAAEVVNIAGEYRDEGEEAREKALNQRFTSDFQPAGWVQAGGAEGAPGTGSKEESPGKESAGGKLIVERVNPVYPAPPATKEDLAWLELRIEETLQLRTGALQCATENGLVAKQTRAQQKKVEVMSKGRDDSEAAALAYQTFVDRHLQLNQEKQKREEEASAVLSGHKTRMTGIAALRGPLATWKGAMGIGSKIWPDLKDAYDDAQRMSDAISRIDEEGTEQAAAQPVRAAAVGDEKTKLDKANAESSLGQAALSGAAAPVKQADSALGQKADNASAAQVKAEQRATDLAAAADKGDKLHGQLVGDINKWSKDHRAARKKAVDRTKAQLEGMGYRIKEVKGPRSD